MHNVSSVIVLAWIYLAAGKIVKPASFYFKICHKSDAEIAGCIKRTLTDAAPRLVKGVAELGMVPLDPLFVPRLEIKDGANNFNFKQVFTDLSIYGMGKFKIENVKVDLAKNFIELHMFSPSIDLLGKYAMDVHVLNLHMKGSGQCKISFTNMKTNAFFQNEVYTKEGKDYIRVKDLKWEISPQNASFYFSNLFNGDKRLGVAANRFVNENWRDAFKIYKHLPEEAFGNLLKDISNRVYSHFPVEELFPD